MTTIGFFGDSFCAEVSNQHSESNGYKTYIEKLISHYNADLVNFEECVEHFLFYFLIYLK